MRNGRKEGKEARKEQSRRWMKPQLGK